MRNYAPINDSKDVVTKEYIDPIKSQAAINRTTLGTQCKNLLKHSATTKTINGITFTVNSDSTITASGTATANAVFKFVTLTLKPGTYKYSGISITPSTSTANMSVFRTSDWVGLCALAEKDTFTITDDTKIECRAVIYNGYTANNVVFKPMVRYADITDGSYEPYSDNVDTRLIKTKSDIAINKSTLGYQRKNMLKNTAKTSTMSGVTFTVNDDKSITVSGTNTSSSSSAYIQLCGLVDYGDGKLIASIGQNITDVYMAVYDSDWNWIGTGSAGRISWENSSKKRLVRLVVKPGATINNVTVYPMIRYADILDDTYEPYQPSVQEQTAYSISVSGKSTSAAISYSGVPTLICLTPNTADSTAGGLYMINSAGAVVKLIEKTGVVVAADTASNTFTITNNTSTVMDVCISRCWGR